MFSARFRWASSPTAGDLKKIVIVQSLYRGRKARRQLVKRKENAIYRANVAREIEKTEEDYVKNLNVVIEHYLKPLKERMEDEKTDAGAMANFNSLFSDIQVIRNYNGNLLNDLRPRMQKWSAHQGIGDIFVQMSAFLKVYTQYVSRYNKAMVELTTYKKSDPRVLEMLKKISEEVGNQEINSFLIRPIQRIPRYRLLLKDLLKHTEEDHNDFQALSSAYKQVSDVAEFIEEKASEAERIGKLLDVQSRLLGNETQSIAAPSRKYVREGRLAVGFAKDNKVRRERMVFLFNDLLVDTKPVKKSGVEVFKFKNSYHLVQLLPVILPDDLKENRFGFALRADGDTVDVVRFFAASTQERDEWVNDLNSLRQDINAKREHHNDLVLERAKKRALKAKLAFSERYRKADGGEGTTSAGNLAVSEVKEASKQPAAALLKGMSPRAPNRWEKEHQSRKEEMAEEAGVKPQGHQSRWESRLKAHQERLRSLQGEESGQAAGGEDSMNKEFADDASGWKSLPATPELTTGSRRKAWREKRASADLTTLLAVNGSNSPVSESPPSPRKSGGLFSTLLRKRDEAKRRDGSGRRNTMSGTFNTMGISKRSPSWERKKSDEDSSSSKEEDALMAGSADNSLDKPPAAEEPPTPPKLTRKEKRNYRKTFSSVDVAQMSRLQRSWGSSNNDTSVVAASLEKLMLQEQQEHKQQVHQQQQQHLHKLKESSGEYAMTAKAEQQSGSSGRRIRSGAYDESAVAEVMSREASSESLGGAAGPSTSGAPSPSSSPAPSRTKNPFAYLKKRGDDKEKEKEKEKEREKAKEKEVVNINPIRGIHLIPTFAAAAAAAYHANNATSAGLGVAPSVAPSPPSLELSDSTDMLAGSSAAIIVSPPSGGATSTRGLTNSQSMELDTIAAQPAQSAPPNATRKVRPMSMDLTGKKPDAIRPSDPNGAIDEEWERRKKHLLDEWKKEDREREKLLKAAKNQMKKELKKSARQEKKEKEKEIKDEKKLRKAERKLRPKSMDFSRRRLDSLLQRMASDPLDDSDDEEADNAGGHADNAAHSEGDMSASVATHMPSNAVHLRVRPKTSRAESVPDRVRRERSRSAIGSNGNSTSANSLAAVGDHPAQPTVSTTWMSANEEEALTIEEIDRRISDLKRLRQRKLASASAGGAPAASTDGDASKPTSRTKSGSRISSREDGRVDSLSGSGSRERHHQSERRSSATDAMPMSPTAADRKIHSEEMSALAVVTTSSPIRTRSRANTSNPPPSASSPYSTFSASGSAITRRDKEKEKEREKEREREKEKEREKEREREKEKEEKEKEASRARVPVSRAATKRVRPVSMDVSGMRLSDLISTGGESGGDRLDARLAATRPSTAAVKEAMIKAAEGAAAKTRRGTALPSGSWDGKRDREREKEKEKDRARGDERDTKEKEKRKSGGSSIGGRESERRNSIVREKEKEKEREKEEKSKEERRENGHHDGEPEKKSIDKDKEKARDKRRSQDKDKPRDRDHAHQRERDRERDNKEKDKGKDKEKDKKEKDSKEKSTKKGSVISPPSGLGANSSSPAGWEERKKDRTSSTKQRAESTS